MDHLALSAETPVADGSAALAATATFSILPFSAAGAHEAPKGWNCPFSRCANYDCKEMSAKATSERPDGYVVQPTGEVVGYADKRVKDSPDGGFHWRAHQSGLDAGKTICLFVPPRSFRPGGGGGPPASFWFLSSASSVLEGGMGRICARPGRAAIEERDF